LTLVQLRSLLDTVVDAPVWSLDDARVHTRLAQGLAVRASMDELVARLVAQVDDRGRPRSPVRRRPGRTWSRHTGCRPVPPAGCSPRPDLNNVGLRARDPFECPIASQYRV